MEEYKELAAGRLSELEKLMSDHETTKREVELLKNKVKINEERRIDAREIF